MMGNYDTAIVFIQRYILGLLKGIFKINASSYFFMSSPVFLVRNVSWFVCSLKTHTVGIFIIAENQMKVTV